MGLFFKNPMIPQPPLGSALPALPLVVLIARFVAVLRSVVGFIAGARNATEKKLVFVHSRETLAHLAGNIVFEGKTSSQPDSLSKLLRAKASDAARMVLETGSLASWLWHELRGRNFPVICLDARHVRAALSMRVNKTDRNDARGLAELARMGWYREANVKARRVDIHVRCWRHAPSWSTFDEMSKTRCAVCSRVSASPPGKAGIKALLEKIAALKLQDASPALRQAIDVMLNAAPRR